MNFNGSCPSLVENYTWVDERLREMYYGYALTCFNCSEYEAEGLLKENWSWVDDRLEQMSKITGVNIFEPMSASLTIANYSVNTTQECLKEEENHLSRHKCSNSESNISDYEEEAESVVKSLKRKSQLTTCKYCNELFDNKIAVGNYDEEYELDMEVSSSDSVIIECDIEEEMERLVTINSNIIFSDYSDDESILLDFCDSP